ncbi:MAG: ubiquitin-like protein UBact [Armatimonadetes bacterium]|nr:ubiquitin-like protein UBact [Armatimonadota bacterium]
MIIRTEDRLRKPIPQERSTKHGDEDGPKSPKVDRPGANELLKRMRKVDPEQAKKYRQRSGE